MYRCKKAPIKPIVQADCKKRVLWIPALLWGIWVSIAASKAIEDEQTRLMVIMLILAFCLWQTCRWVPMAFTHIEAYPDFLVVKRFGKSVQRLEYSKINVSPRRSGHNMIEYRMQSNVKTVLRYNGAYSHHELLYDWICCKVCENQYGFNSPEAKKKRTDFQTRYKNSPL